MFEQFKFIHEVRPANGDPLINRDDEIQKIKKTLRKKYRRNILLIGEPGSGKTAIIRELSKTYPIWEFNISQAISGTKYRGDYEERVCDAIKEIEYQTRLNPRLIIFIDESHTLFAGRWLGGLSLGDMIKTSLDTGSINLIGATTINEYNQYFKTDLALCRRFSNIFINPLDKELWLSIAQSKFPNATIPPMPETCENLDQFIDYVDYFLA